MQPTFLPAVQQEIEYELTRDDLFAFQMRASTATPSARRMMRRTRVVYGLVIIGMAILMRPWRSWFSLTAFGVFFSVFVGGGIVAYRYVLRRAIKEMVQENMPEKGQLGRHRIRVDENGLTESTAVGQSRVTWEGIDRVERDSTALFIYTGPHQAHMIPIRAFASLDDAESFYAFVKSRAERESTE